MEKIVALKDPEIDISHNPVLFDWVTISTKIHEPSDIIELLGMTEQTWEQLDYGFNMYSKQYKCGHISVLYGGRANDMGVCLSMSGQGCREFEEFGNGDYMALFRLVLEHYHEKSENREMNISRIDVANDVFNGLLPIDNIFDDARYHTRNFVAKFTSSECRESSKRNRRVITVYLGSEDSDYRIRFYDKKAERERDNIESWIRCEQQLKGNYAVNFIRKLINDKTDVCSLFFSVLRSEVRFVKPTGNDDNKRRWDMADYWAKYIGEGEKVCIYTKPGTEYNLGKMYAYITEQTSGAIYSYIEMFGIDELDKAIREAREGKPLNPKYFKLISEYKAEAEYETILRNETKKKKAERNGTYVNLDDELFKIRKAKDKGHKYFFHSEVKRLIREFLPEYDFVSDDTEIEFILKWFAYIKREFPKKYLRIAEKLSDTEREWLQKEIEPKPEDFITPLSDGDT
jgi:hypothetical protein